MAKGLPQFKGTEFAGRSEAEIAEALQGDVASIVDEITRRRGMPLDDDMLSAGNMGLLQAIRGFNRSRSAFRTYLYNCIKWAIGRHDDEDRYVGPTARFQKRRARVFTFCKPLRGGRVTLGDYIAESLVGDSGSPDLFCRKHFWRQATKGLRTKQQRKAALLRYRDGLKHREIGVILGVSHSRAAYIDQECLAIWQADETLEKRLET